jgi:hypothetical protein
MAAISNAADYKGEAATVRDLKTDQAVVLHTNGEYAGLATASTVRIRTWVGLSGRC